MARSKLLSVKGEWDSHKKTSFRRMQPFSIRTSQDMTHTIPVDSSINSSYGQRNGYISIEKMRG